MSLSAPPPPPWLPGKVPPPVTEDTCHGSVPQLGQVRRDARVPRGSAEVAVPLPPGKGSVAGTAPGVGCPPLQAQCQTVGCPSAGGHHWARPSRALRLCPLLCPWHRCLGTACAGAEGWAGVSKGTIGQSRGPCPSPGVLLMGCLS